MQKKQILNANKNSNSRVRQSSRMNHWQDTNGSEIKQFLGIVMYMGLVKYPSIHMYWSKNEFYKNSFVPNIMTRNRFQLLLKFIHFSSETELPTNRLKKVKDLVEVMEKNFVAAKIPGKMLVVDETMIPWRGRLIFRQYNPGKSHKYGVKLYKLCDPTGYTYTSSIYCGKAGNTMVKGQPTALRLHTVRRSFYI